MIDEKLFNHLYEKAKSAILDIDDKELDDIYAILFLLECLSDDLRRPSFVVGYNTESHFKTQIEEASDEGEARWNYDFWLQNELTVLGGDDPVFQEWVCNSEYYCTDEENNKFSKETKKKLFRLDDICTEAWVNIAAKLQSEGVIRQKFGRELPIIVHELEYYSDTIKWTKKANPKKLIVEFLEWYKNM